MSLPDDDAPDPQFVGLYDGIVLDRADPKRLGRVRVRVPGIIDSPGVWAWPIGGPGGGGGVAGDGTEAPGFFRVPEVGADVAILFKQGDPDRPRYLAGNWGAPGGVQQIPLAARGLTPEQTPNVAAFETRRYAIEIDDNPGQERLTIRDKATPEGGADIIELDGAANGVVIRGTVGVVIESTGAVAINALTITLNGRPVKDSAEPI